MAVYWRRGCVWAVGMLIGTLVLLSALAGIGIIVGLQQPDHIWATPVGGGYFAIGRIASKECLRLQARRPDIQCPQTYGALLYLSHAGHGVEYTLLAIPDPRTRR